MHLIASDCLLAAAAVASGAAVVEVVAAAFAEHNLEQEGAVQDGQ